MGGVVAAVTSCDCVPTGDEGKYYRSEWETRNVGREMSVKWGNFCWRSCVWEGEGVDLGTRELEKCNV